MNLGKCPEKLYGQLVAYFENVVQVCSPQIGLRLSTSDYEEKWSELHRKYYSNERDKALHNYDHVVATREVRGFTSIDELHEYYAEEDEAYFSSTRHKMCSTYTKQSHLKICVK